MAFKLPGLGGKPSPYGALPTQYGGKPLPVRGVFLTALVLVPLGMANPAATLSLAAYQFLLAFFSFCPILFAAFFLLVGEEGIETRLWPALKWSVGALLAATVILGIPALTVLEGWVARHLAALLQIAFWLDAAWLVALAVLAWRGQCSDRWAGVLLGLAVGSSIMVSGPIHSLGMIWRGDNGASLIVFVPLIPGFMLAMLLMMLVAAFLAWLVRLPKRRLRPLRLLAGLAMTFALLRVAGIVAGL